MNLVVRGRERRLLWRPLVAEQEDSPDLTGARALRQGVRERKCCFREPSLGSEFVEEFSHVPVVSRVQCVDFLAGGAGLTLEVRRDGYW